MEQPALLEMRNITKEFPGVKALDGVSLTVRPGTVHALMGENIWFSLNFSIFILSLPITIVLNL